MTSINSIQLLFIGSLLILVNLFVAKNEHLKKLKKNMFSYHRLLQAGGRATIRLNRPLYENKYSLNLNNLSPYGQISGVIVFYF